MRRKKTQLNSRRIPALILALVLLVGTVPFAFGAEVSGTCGDSLSWSLSAGTLTLTGSGEMQNFSEPEMAPWYPYRQEIQRLVLPDGLTGVGNLAFYGCDRLTAVRLPDSVRTVGKYAFGACGSLTVLNLGNGLTDLEEGAFTECYALPALTLPDSLKTVGMKAFYRCEALTSITIPESVESIGVSAFGYCKSLVRADIQADISELPEWVFYGCENLSVVTLPRYVTGISADAFRGCDQLSTVYYDGIIKTQDEIRDMVADSVTGFDSTGAVSDSKPAETVTSGTFTENADGSVTQENVTVAVGSGSFVSTSISHTYTPDSGAENRHDVEMTVTVNGAAGWKEAQQTVEQSLKEMESVTGVGRENQPVKMNVYLTGTDEIDQDFVDALAGNNMQITVVTQSGSRWSMETSQMDTEDLSGEYDLSYELTAGTQELREELAAQSCFILRFKTSAEVNAEVVIPLGSGFALQNATLFQRAGDGLVRHQSVVVDRSGSAHFYLASVDSETEYYIAMNLPEEEGESAIVPSEMLEDFGAAEQYVPIQYRITGRTSSWNMEIGQVTLILVGVLVACVIAVGVTLYLLNKRKLKKGYVVDLDDYEI